MTTETLDEMWSRPSAYDLDSVDRDPFDEKKPKGRISMIRMLMLLIIFFGILVPQLIRPDGEVIEGKIVKSTVCRLNFLCHATTEDNLTICICPPLIAKIKVD
ncbi:MAG: hypothetical protein ABIF10_00225 [Candidatus Woesearchaeota archaeon]